MLNLCHNGNDGIARYSDDEKSLEKNSTIASSSFGAERKFYFKHKHTKVMISVVLEHGCLVILKDATRMNWLYSLPRSKKNKWPENKPNFSNDSTENYPRIPRIATLMRLTTCHLTSN